MSPSPLAKAGFHAIGSEAILLIDERLFYLNHTAAFIWCCLESGRDPNASADALSERFGISPEVAREDVMASLAEWRSLGVFNQGAWRRPGSEVDAPVRPTDVEARPIKPFSPGTGSKLVAPTRRRPAQPVGERNADVAGHQHRGVLSVGGLEHHYRVGSLCLRICFSSPASQALVHPILAHLAVGTGNQRSCRNVSLKVEEMGEGFALHRNGTPIEAAVPGIELAPLVQRELLLAVYHATDCLIAIHAASLSFGGGSLLLPGASGSGKSTLAAALLGAGLTYLTDELVLLMRGSHVIRPVPVSLGIKAGSWQVLESRFPRLAAVPVFRQQDGTEVRYLLPPADQVGDRDEYAAGVVVFPHYRPEGPTGLRTISAAQAFYRLAEAGYAVPGPLESSTVTELIAWISRMQCYELGVRDLSEAVVELKRLIA